MSWFKKAQIWERDSREDTHYRVDFSLYLIELYRLTYIYNEIRRRISTTWHSESQRFQSILNNVKSNLTSVGQQVKEQIVAVYEDWLQGHALLSPQTWAEARVRDNVSLVEEGDLKTQLQAAINEYRGWQKGIKDYDVLSLIMGNIKKTPYFKEFLTEYAVEYINGYDADELREIYQLSKRVNPYDVIIKNIKSGKLDLADIVPIDSLETLLTLIEQNPEIDEEISIVLYRDYVFPSWFEHWKPQGIERTRERIEQVYSQLQNVDPSNLDNFLATINIAVNTMHQSGSMAGHLESKYGEDIEGIMNELTNGKFNAEWDNQINELFGVKPAESSRTKSVASN